MTTLVTRCPQCRAAFRVVAEQLSLRGGKVRCGVCNAVFDARAHQEPGPEQPVPQVPAAAPRPPVAAEPPAARRIAEHSPAVLPVRSTGAETLRSEPDVSAAARKPAPPVRSGPGSVTQRPAASVRHVPATPVQPAAPPAQVRTTLAPQARMVSSAQRPEISDDAHQAAPMPASGQSPEPWLSEEAATRPVPARAGRQREPSLGAARRPETGMTHKREPVFKTASTTLPMPASPPDRFDPPLPRQTDHRFSDETRSDDAFPGDAASHHHREHHVPFVSDHGDARRSVQHAIPTGSSAAHQPVHETEDFVAHGPRSGYSGSLRSTRRSGAMQAFWGVCCIVAGFALVLQALWWWRTPIATHVPVMRPVYDAVCAGMGCRVGYVRMPGQLSIESSSIQPQALAQPSGKTQNMTLSAVLRNRAPHAQPWPAIELTLTDFASVVVVRRILQPSEYLPPGAPEYFASNTEREIAASLEVRGAPVSGYRLALFFP